MPGTMPYVLDKGPYFSVVENKLDNLPTRAQALNALRAMAPPANGQGPGQMVADICGFDSTNLGSPNPPRGDRRTPADRRRHLNEDWFGMSDSSGAWKKRTPLSVPTGCWTNYAGDPEAILREAMIRAIEISFNIAHGGALPAEVPALDDWGAAVQWQQSHQVTSRHWPIDVTWICQGPFFQCWVTWRKLDNSPTGGRVSVLITTPALVCPNTTPYPLTSQITRPLENDPTPPGPDYHCPPLPNAPGTDSHGIWVIGHENYTPIQVPSTLGTQPGGMNMPSVTWVAQSTTVVTVEPAEWEGGVLQPGRPYTP
jgi:hypothetical protein